MAAAKTRTLVERWLGAGDAGDLDEFDEYLHRDVVVHAPLGLSTSGVEAEKAVWRAALEAMPGLRHTVQEAVVEGTTIPVRAIVTGTLVGEFRRSSGGGSRLCSRPDGLRARQ
jgi:ketosteroid isomerase-like protein